MTTPQIQRIVCPTRDMGPSEEHRERSTAIYAESPLYAALAVMFVVERSKPLSANKQFIYPQFI